MKVKTSETLWKMKALKFIWRAKGRPGVFNQECEATGSVFSRITVLLVTMTEWWRWRGGRKKLEAGSAIRRS